MGANVAVVGIAWADDFEAPGLGTVRPGYDQVVSPDAPAQGVGRGGFDFDKRIRPGLDVLRSF